MSKHKDDPLDAVCPVCGIPVTFKVADEIEQKMDDDNYLCPRCCSTFGEQRREI